MSVAIFFNVRASCRARERKTFCSAMVNSLSKVDPTLFGSETAGAVSILVVDTSIPVLAASMTVSTAAAPTVSAIGFCFATLCSAIFDVLSFPRYFY